MWKTLDVEDLKQSISDGKKKKRIESYSLHKEPFFVCERELCIQTWELFMKTQISMAVKPTFCGRKEMSLGFRNNNRGTKKKEAPVLASHWIPAKPLGLWKEEFPHLLTLKSAFSAVVGGHGKSGGVGVRSRGHIWSWWWWLFSGGGGHGGKRGGYGVTLHLHGGSYSVVVVVGEKGGGYGVTLHLHGGGYSVVVVVGEKGVVMVSPFIFMVVVIQWWWSWGKKGWLWCHPSSSWWWLFSGGGHGKKTGGYGVTLHLHGDGYSVVVVVMGKKGWLWCHPSSSWWWLFSGGGRGEKRGGYGVTLHLHGDGYSVVVVVGGKSGGGGGVTLHLHGDGYSLVLVSGYRLRLATVNALQVQPAGLLQAEPFSEQDVVVDPLVVLRCDERVFRWEAWEVQVWWMGLWVRCLRSSGVMNGFAGKKFRCDEWVQIRSSGVMNESLDEKLKKFRSDEWVVRWEA